MEEAARAGIESATTEDLIAELSSRGGSAAHSVMLGNAEAEELLRELASRGGCEGQVAEAQLLCFRKARDYNGRGVARDDYFPLGLASYAQMLHTKSLRLVSLAAQDGEPNFESARDTALDIINYASFLADWLAREGR